MAVRIYSLAKELKIDSKDLVEMCHQAGVAGKGSALASLTDEEEVVVRAFVAAGGRTTVRPAPAKAPPSSGKPPAMVRPPVTVSKPLPMLAPAAPPPAAPAAEEPVMAPLPDLAPEAPTPAPAPPTLASRREDFAPPAVAAMARPPASNRSDRMPMLENRRLPSGDGPKAPVNRQPAIKLAPLPPMQQPTSAPKSNEPAPQKPDIKLPPDAIRASKIGNKPLSEHLRKHEEKRKSDATKKTAGPRGPAGPTAAPLPLGTPGRGGGRGRRPGGVAAEDEASKGDLRQIQRKKSSGRRRGRDDDDGPRGRRQIRRVGTNTAAPRKSNAVVELPCTVRSFSEAIGVPAARVLGKLLALNAPQLNISATLDPELAELLAAELGVSVDFKKPADLEDRMLSDMEQREDAAEEMEPRAPVVTFLGHVDHGKTSLLDRIIGIDVVSGESGGITQHIRAYRIERNGQPIAFVDTPGHEAFTQMRARGAQVTDIAVLVVAADDGVMPQTEEAISHARAAGVPIVVALNKIDLPGANPQRIYEQLAANELLPVEWGGETEVVKCSALTGEGMDKLLETLLLTAELHDYRVNPHRPGYGTCLESELHEGRGVVVKLLVQRGTLKVGDVVVCGSSYGRVKAMYDTLQPRKTYEAAGPSTPVQMTGLDEAPAAGEHFYVLDDIVAAREIASKRGAQSRAVVLGGQSSHVTLENLYDKFNQDEVQNLNLILRADVRGSIEAIQKELLKLEHPEVQIKILQATVGGISEADVHLADASDAIIIGFNVVPDEGARALAERTGVQVRRYDIIYQVSQDLKAALEGLLKPERRETDLGRALVLRLFTISRVGTIAGCRVLAGNIARNSRMRVIRDNRVIGDYPIDSLRREKDDAREVREGLECGIKLSGYNDLKEGDVLEAYKIEEVARTI